MAEVLAPGAQPHVPAGPGEPRPLGVAALEPALSVQGGGGAGDQGKLPDPQRPRHGAEETQPHVCSQVLQPRCCWVQNALSIFDYV